MKGSFLIIFDNGQTIHHVNKLNEKNLQDLKEGIVNIVNITDQKKHI